MQLYARDEKGICTLASQALKQIDYYCLECSQTLRLRSGLHRQSHFYHLRTNHACSQQGKSMTHLMLQNYLEQLLPKNEVKLECPFPVINRIADVVWLSSKIIFEIQCSPISAEEVIARNKDYGSQGYLVIWILHDNQYNQEKMSLAEKHLLNSPHYFTDMDSEGNGGIYEQLSLSTQAIRRFRLPKLPVDLSIPKDPINFLKESGFPFPIPQLIEQRLTLWPINFSGDIFDLYLNFSEKFIEYAAKISEAEEKWRSSRKKMSQKEILAMPIGKFFKFIFSQIAHFYSSLLHLFLEKTSR